LYATWSDGATRLVVGDHGFVARATGEGALRRVRVPTSVALHAVTMNARGVALAVGAEGTILRSTDRGARWRRVAVPAAERSFHAVWLDDEGHAVAVGERGHRFRSDDGGRTWQSLSLGRDDHMIGMTAHGSTLWVVGADGRIERSEDHGRTWQAEAPPAPAIDLKHVLVTERGTLLVTTRPGTVWRRDASGRWTSIVVHPSALLSGIAGGARRIVAVASDGASFVSTDDGATWSADRPATREVLTSVFVAPDGRAYATGYWGVLLTRP
ncbi:MAG: YCF48-related protein, partial [Myxococcota bacterium]|nr:YCF48-related protein [Myxococcota bacterium]